MVTNIQSVETPIPHSHHNHRAKHHAKLKFCFFSSSTIFYIEYYSYSAANIMGTRRSRRVIKNRPKYSNYDNNDAMMTTTMMTTTTTNYPSLVLRGKEMVKNQIFNHHQPKENTINANADADTKNVEDVHMSNSGFIKQNNMNYTRTTG
ncbi:MAG: hypothetical protein ACI8RD_006472 [Bacillariaceae sp.]|jgi:hypothetical protein